MYIPMGLLLVSTQTKGGVIGGPAPNNLENYGGKKPVHQLITWDSTHLEFLIAL